MGWPIPDTLADIELFLWIRRAHRSARVGDFALREMMRAVNGQFTNMNKPIRVRARFPEERGINLEHDRDLWVNFFSTFDFRPATGTRATDVGELVLYRIMN